MALLHPISLEDYPLKPVCRMEIQKPDGGVRNLDIPTVTDHPVQQMMVRLMVPISAPMFSDPSFGFRSGRSSHDAIMRVAELYDGGYAAAVSMDPGKYSDSTPWNILVMLIRRTIRGFRLTKPVRRFLKGGAAMSDGPLVRTMEGTPRGGPPRRTSASTSSIGNSNAGV